MNATGSIINAILVLLVVRQIRGNRLDLLNVVLPVVLVVGAAAYYLRGVPTPDDHSSLGRLIFGDFKADGEQDCQPTRHRRLRHTRRVRARRL